jgi:hypothetical protein
MMCASAKSAVHTRNVEDRLSGKEHYSVKLRARQPGCRCRGSAVVPASSSRLNNRGSLRLHVGSIWLVPAESEGVRGALGSRPMSLAACPSLNRSVVRARVRFLQVQASYRVLGLNDCLACCVLLRNQQRLADAAEKASRAVSGRHLGVIEKSGCADKQPRGSGELSGASLASSLCWDG